MESDQESSECPLCLEVLEADDLTFFPCTCCYQICRFCWHRIRTDENGLCPACRKPYSENPAQFKPLTDEELQQVKRDRKLKDSVKKPKTAENRKHLANLRVVQRNLVFVNGLPSRFADTDLLRRNDHFGKYGKIVKLVTSPAHNGQLNSICVYITYSRSEEALNAIQSLSNYSLDGRTLKATLGTTKYCSRFLKGATCQKADCLYLHEQGDPLASFTKEQMQQGLHLDYERKLMEQYANKLAKANRMTTNSQKNDSSQKRKEPFLSSANNYSNSPNTLNGQSDFESGDEAQQMNCTFTSTTAMNGDTLNVDSDFSSTSSQTSSEHDPSLQTRISPTKTWSDDARPSSSDNNQTNESSTALAYDQIPEYKLFSTTSPSIHTILFGNNETIQTRDENNKQSIEENTSYSQTQENDELGFDPCNLFMSALASDIEDERRPLSTQTSSYSSRPVSNSYGYDSSWMNQQTQPQKYAQTTTTTTNGNSFSSQTWNGNSSNYRLDYSNTFAPQRNQWMNNVPWTDPAIISFGTKLDQPISSSSSQWSASTLSSGNNLISNLRWPQQQTTQTHLISNGIFTPFSTATNLNNGNRS